MKKLRLFCSLFCFLPFFLLLPFAQATEIEVELKSVHDRAELLSPAETQELESLCETITSKHSIHLFLLTENSIPGNRKEYLEDFYDSIYGEVSDAFLLLINMDSSDRGVEMQGYGQCEFYLSDDRIAEIYYSILPFLSDGKYFDAMKLFTEMTDTYMNTEPTTDYQHTEEDNEKYIENLQNTTDNPQKQPFDFWFVSLRNLVISVIAGGIVVGIMAYNSGGKTTTNQGTYLDSKNSRVLGKRDRYIRTTTTKRPKPSDDNHNSGGGFSSGGGVSSGGHSHSGGGGKF